MVFAFSSIVAEQPIRPLAKKNSIKLKRIQKTSNKRSKIVTIPTNQTTILKYFDRIILTKDSLDRASKEICDLFDIMMIHEPWIFQHHHLHHRMFLYRIKHQLLNQNILPIKPDENCLHNESFERLNFNSSIQLNIQFDFFYLFNKIFSFLFLLFCKRCCALMIIMTISIANIYSNYSNKV